MVHEELEDFCQVLAASSLAISATSEIRLPFME
jgi:hypothetical protein